MQITISEVLYLYAYAYGDLLKRSRGRRIVQISEIEAALKFYYPRFPWKKYKMGVIKNFIDLKLLRKINRDHYELLSVDGDLNLYKLLRDGRDEEFPFF
jgi:hypothetical protein